MTNSFLAKMMAFFMICGVVTFTSCTEDDGGDTPVIELNVVETAQDDAQFSTLVDALVKADLVNTLNDGTYTVFAPTNAAFNQLFTDLGVSGLDDLSAATLTPILLYHVVAGDVRSTDLTSGYVGTASTGPNNQALKLKVEVENGVTLDNAVNVTSADVVATNGVIHVIDEVLLPNNVVNIALQNSNFTSLVAALTRADLSFDFVDFLSGDGPFTVFAPTNDAFQALLDSNDQWNSLNDIDVTTLDAVLKYHVISGTNFESGALSDNLVGTTAGGNEFTINTANGVTVTDPNGTSNVVLADVQGTNGVVHVIDRVLIP